MASKPDTLPITVDNDNQTLLTNVDDLWIVLKTTHVLKQENELYCIPTLYFTIDKGIAKDIYDLLDDEQIVDIKDPKYAHVYYNDGIFYMAYYFNESRLVQINRSLKSILESSEDVSQEEDMSLKIREKQTYLALFRYPDKQEPIARIEPLALTADISMSILEQMADWINMLDNITGQKAYDRLMSIVDILGLDRDSIFLETWIAQTLVCNDNINTLYRNSQCKQGKMLRFKQVVKNIYPIRQFYFENIKTAIPNLVARKQERLTEFDRMLLGL